MFTHKKPLHLIYVPGLGDHNIAGQTKAVNIWKYWGVSAEICQMLWREGPWDAKLKKLLSMIDDAAAEGKDVALVGASAGASAALNAYAQRKDKIVGVVLIAGWASFRHNKNYDHTAFGGSSKNVKHTLPVLGKAERRRILSRYGIIDPMVPGPYSHLRGAHNRLSPTIGHIMTIAVQLTLGAPSFIWFLRRRQSELS